MRLDFSVTDPALRVEAVTAALGKCPHPNERQLAYMADYLLAANESSSTRRERASEYPIITKNREVTVSKRQMSYDSLVSDLATGEDGVYMMLNSDRDAILDPKDPITESDLDSVPGLRANYEVIDSLRAQLDATKDPARRRSLKSQIVSKHKECYAMRRSHQSGASRPRPFSQVRALAHMELPEHVYLDSDGNPRSDAFLTLLNPRHVLFLLRFYQALKAESRFDFMGDMWYLLRDLEGLVARTLAGQPMLQDVVRWEVDGMTGSELVQAICDKYGCRHSEQYFSTLWTTKIPRMISRKAAEEWLVWHYTYEDPSHAHWKICRSCGQAKLAHPYFYNRNTSSDGFYSKCRECRSKGGGA